MFDVLHVAFGGNVFYTDFLSPDSSYRGGEDNEYERPFEYMCVRRMRGRATGRPERERGSC